MIGEDNYSHFHSLAKRNPLKSFQMHPSSLFLSFCASPQNVKKIAKAQKLNSLKKKSC